MADAAGKQRNSGVQEDEQQRLLIKGRAYKNFRIMLTFRNDDGTIAPPDQTIIYAGFSWLMPTTGMCDD
jgi:hypothetical protein